MSTPVSSAAEQRLELFHIIERLKTTKRTGWVREGVKEPESISDHMYRMAMLALLSDDPHLDIAKCVMLAIVHDFAEAEVGDITPFDNIPRSEKQRREAAAMEQFSTVSLSPESLAAKRLMSLWNEYEDGKTKEAKFVKDLDRFELALQGVEYERRDRLSTLQPFFGSSVSRIVHPEVQGWAATLMDERKALHGEKPFAEGFQDVRPGQGMEKTTVATKAACLGMEGGSTATPL